MLLFHFDTLHSILHYKVPHNFTNQYRKLAVVIAEALLSVMSTVVFFRGQQW